MTSTNQFQLNRIYFTKHGQTFIRIIKITKKTIVFREFMDYQFSWDHTRKIETDSRGVDFIWSDSRNRILGLYLADQFLTQDQVSQMKGIKDLPIFQN